jgi:hypothetical protein
MAVKTVQGMNITIIQGFYCWVKTVFAPMHEAFARGEDGTNSEMLGNK